MAEPIKLKYKYTFRNEPESWRGKSGKKNCKQYGSSSGGNQGKSHTKKILKPTGSGRTIGNMIRRYTTVVDRKKK
jgi:hypothetical protein